VRLEGKLAVITAAGSGMGRAACILFANEGATVVAVDVARGPLDETVAAIVGEGRRAHALQADLADAGDCRRAVREAATVLGGIDIFWNHVGSPAPNVIENLEIDEYNLAMSLNLTSSVIMAGEVVPFLRARGGGAILFTASTSGLVGSPRSPIYSAGKFGVVGLTKSLAVRYGPERIRVNALCPGLTDTPMAFSFTAPDGREETSVHMTEVTRASIPLRRIATPEDVAHAALFLASDDASYITGVALPIDGGATAM
jgi:NAD(P)-dependent dehydrogenase (short-subunit alcohol dehydrogenase family)